MPLILEIVCDSIRSVFAAAQGGANRIELCDNLSEGGTTPSFGMITMAREATRIPIHVMIRPRAGDFHYTPEEIKVMINDIRVCKELKADGIVIGILKRNGRVNTEQIRELVGIARPLSVTFHRAFDLTSDPVEALEDIISCFCDRLLTSGQSDNAESGMDLIRDLQKAAGGRIQIMAGAGVTKSNAMEIIRHTGITEVHMSARSIAESEMFFRREDISMGAPGLSSYQSAVVDEAIVRKMRLLLDSN